MTTFHEAVEKLEVLVAARRESSAHGLPVELLRLLTMPQPKEHCRPTRRASSTEVLPQETP